MQPAAAQSKRVTDLASTVLATMRQMGVAGLPRNYEIYYEALAGSNEELSLEVVSLPNRPSQEDLDQIGRKYFAHHHGYSVVDDARRIVAAELEEVAGLLRSERSHLERYSAILSQGSAGLTGRQSTSRELLEKILAVVSVATTTTIEQGRQTAETLNEKTVELEAVKTKLQEYKRLADTDPLTQLSNRRAFDRELLQMFENRGTVSTQALLLADIDSFKAINDQFGHPVGDKVIQMTAGFLRSKLRADTFVARTGGEEFAVLVEGAPEDTMMAIAERVRQAVEQASLTSLLGPGHKPVTVSFGLCMVWEAESADDLYAKADRALYRSKMNGRNRVTRHSSLNEIRAAPAVAAPAPAPAPVAKDWLIYSQS
ncbi:MAG: GGDEF domain-containing protein [Mesorhizobium amorphae]|nr:MAG: GGDEF domain-containing protein [Mesorhizobium amorphae]